MGIQLSGGTSVNFTWTPVTRLAIINNIEDQLLLAGWSRAVGTLHAADVTMQSATTAAGLACRLRLFDPGTGNCAQLFLQNGAGGDVQTTAFFLNPVGSLYRIIAHKYDFWVMTGASNAREFACGGVLFTPTTLTTTQNIFGCGNSENDTNTLLRSALRNSHYSVNGPYYANYNGNFYTTGVLSGTGVLELVGVAGANYSTQCGYRWHDDSAINFDPLLAWGLTAATDEAKIAGQIHDALFVNKELPGDFTFTTADAKNWFVISKSVVGSGSAARGALCVLIP